jgi:hypothetical protein
MPARLVWAWNDGFLLLYPEWHAGGTDDMGGSKELSKGHGRHESFPRLVVGFCGKRE